MYSLEQEDLKYIWHPFTQMQDWLRETPLVIESASGVYLKDIHGNKYIDGVSSLWTNVHGHKKLEIDNAIRRQLRKVSHSTFLGLSNKPAVQLAKKLVEITPSGLQKVFYSDNGSTAMEIALKIAYQYWRQKDNGKYSAKKKFITLKEAYHGDTIGSVSLGGMDLFHKIYKPLLFETIKAPSPYCYRCPLSKERKSCKLDCLTAIERTLKESADTIAAVVMEPLVQGAAGMINQPEGYLSEIRKLCTRYNVLLVLDEVATGFGRTGRMFASEHENVQPDILAMAKGITGGYLPLAATLTTEEIFNAFLGNFEDQKTFYHGHTYTANQLACSAALANLKVFRKENTIDNLQPKIKLLREKLAEFQNLEHVGDIRQQGFMVGIELVADKRTNKPFAAAKRVGHQVIMEARKNGVIIRPLGDVIILMPPLSIQEKELAKLLEITCQAIKTVTVSWSKSPFRGI
ncbi:adenosylmethionine--8-amino-7-oxononanoate transaminase [Candidatus Margulisiibacteriota bacterium]